MKMIRLLRSNTALFMVVFVMSSMSVWAEEGDAADDSGRYFMAMPYGGYTTDTGLFAGAFAQKGYHPERYRISTLGVSTMYSVKKQFSFSGKLDHYFPGGRDRLYISCMYEKYPSYFYGLGNETDNDDAEKYTPEYVKSRVFFEHRVKGYFKIKTGFQFRNQALVQVDREGILLASRAPYARGRFDAGPELALVWDSRDNTLATKNGTLLEAVCYGSVIRNEGGGYNGLALDARKFVTVFSDVVLAYMAEITDFRGHVPFYLYTSLGGYDRLRGYEKNRFVDRSTLLFQYDIRFPVYGSFGGVVFGSTGRVGPDVESLLSGQYHSAFGVGLRWFYNRADNLVLGLDYARGKDSTGFYAGFGEAF